MPRPNKLRSSRQWALWFTVGALFVFFVLLLRGPFAPDPQASFFFKAQQFETRGLTEQALRIYRLISEQHADSPYAPAALEAQANILAGLGRKNGDKTQLQEAVSIYRHLADTYSTDRAAGKALLAAGDIATTDLNDLKQARAIYTAALTSYPNNPDYASVATLKLGRLDLQEGKKEDSLNMLQRVLQQYPRAVDACAEAQYHLGVLFETLYKNKARAENAYQATFQHYPRSVWAANAQERLGLLIFKNADQHPQRLVLLQVQPLHDETGAKDDLISALRPVLAARGIEAGGATLRGWSLEPFWGALDMNNPGRVVPPPFSDFNNVASNANLLYDRRQSADAATALRTLQQEIDAARPVVVYNGAWQLVTGYDSEHQEVFVQNRGARVQAIPVKQFQADWKRKAPDGGSYTLMTFYAPGEKERVKRIIGEGATSAVNAIVRGEEPGVMPPPIGAPTSQPSPTPTQTPLLGVTPAYVFQLKTLSTPDAHRRALRRAAALMRRARADSDTKNLSKSNVLLNLEALNALAAELERLANQSDVLPQALPTDSPVPQPESEATPTATPATAAMPAATALPAATVANPAQQLARAQALVAWFGAPLQAWTSARREAAAYLDTAASALHRPQIGTASAALRESLDELSRAAAALPAAESMGENNQLNDTARRALAEAAGHVRRAADAEKRAVAVMEG